MHRRIIPRPSARLVVLVACVVLGGRPLLPRAAAADDPSTWRASFAEVDAERAHAILRAATAAPNVEHVLPLFEAGLVTPCPHVAFAVGDALRALAPSEAPKELDERIRRVSKDRDVLPRRNLARILAAWGLSTFDAPLAALAGAGSGVEEEALACAASLPVTTDRPFPLTVSAIEAALDDKRPAVRRTACLAAGRRKAKGLVAALVRMTTSDADPVVASFAARALQRIGEPVGLGPFRSVLKSELPRGTRDALLTAIATLSTPADADQLNVLLRARHAPVRHAAAIAVARLASPKRFGIVTTGDLASVPLDKRRLLAAALVKALGAPDRGPLRPAAARALRGFDAEAIDEVVPALVESIGAKDPVTACHAMRTCSRLRLERAFPVILEACFAPEDEGLRACAARALGIFDGDRAVAAFVERFRAAREPEASRRALQALAYVADPKAVRALLTLLRDGALKKGQTEDWNIAMERLTGHRFGAQPEPWEAWASRTSSILLAPMPRPDRDAARAAVLGSAGGPSVATEQAIQRALTWLERCQRPDGSWSPKEDGWGGAAEVESVYTGFCLSAFVGAASRPEDGRFREVIRRGSDYLAAAQQHDGHPSDPGGGFTGSYASIGELQSFAPWFASYGAVEVHGTSDDAFRRGVAQQALDACIDAQIPGWAWHSSGEHVTMGRAAIALQLLVLGRALDLQVDPEAFDGAERWMRACSTDVSGLVEGDGAWRADLLSSASGGQEHRAYGAELPMSNSQRNVMRAFKDIPLTECAASALFLMGWPRSNPLMVGFANTLLDGLPRWMDPPGNPNITWPWHYLWLGGLSAHQAAGPVWRQWSQRISTQLLEHQRVDEPALYGSWDADRRSDDLGRLHCTVLAALSLETWYRLPVQSPR